MTFFTCQYWNGMPKKEVGRQKLLPEQEREFKAGDSKKYEVEVIKNSAVYTKETEEQLPGFYYLVSPKGYPEEENT